jgi:hypothetical protein
MPHEDTSAAKPPDDLVKMGWYLDPSLFLPFIDANVRRALDAAEPDDGKTVLSIRGLSNTKRQSFVPALVGGRRVAFELTSNVDHLRNVHLSNQTIFYYSELTKAEVFRSIRRAHAQRASSEVAAWWEAFRFVMLDYREVAMSTAVGGELSNLALNFPIQKNAQDYMHLITARSANLAFITSDKLAGQLDELQARYYPHIYYWPAIREHLPVLDVFRD